MSPGELDASVIRRHLLALDQALQTLKNHQGRPFEELESDQEERWVVERGLQLCIQNVLDIATHLVASRGRDVPDYATAIDQLADLGILARDFASQFRAVAGFRNVIVHGYLDVDPKIVHRLLNERLDDFAELLSESTSISPRWMTPECREGRVWAASRTSAGFKETEANRKPNQGQGNRCVVAVRS